MALAGLLGCVLAVSASGGEGTPDSLTHTVTAPATPVNPEQVETDDSPPVEEAPAPGPPSTPPPEIDLPPGHRLLTPDEARAYIPPGEEGIITTGVAVKDDPSGVRPGVDCPIGTDVCPASHGNGP
jgi:hypothetical protein